MIRARMTTEAGELEKLAFAKKAAAHFASHGNHTTYTDGDVLPGCLFAVRWGLGEDCVLVFKLDECAEIVNYQQIIRRPL